MVVDPLKHLNPWSVRHYRMTMDLHQVLKDHHYLDSGNLRFLQRHRRHHTEVAGLIPMEKHLLMRTRTFRCLLYLLRMLIRIRMIICHHLRKHRIILHGLGPTLR